MAMRHFQLFSAPALISYDTALLERYRARPSKYPFRISTLIQEGGLIVGTAVSEEVAIDCERPLFAPKAASFGES